MRKCPAKVSHEKKETTKIFQVIFYKPEQLSESRHGKNLGCLPNHVPFRKLSKQVA